MQTTEIRIENPRRARKFGFGWSTQPKRDSTTIIPPEQPQYTGTIKRVLEERGEDPAYRAYGHPNATNFKATLWFYDGQPIVAIRRIGYLKRAADLPIPDEVSRDEPGAYQAYEQRNCDHHFLHDVTGLGWVQFTEDDLVEAISGLEIRVETKASKN